MKIFISYNIRKTKETKNLYNKKRGISISLPTTKLDSKANKRSFVPNLIHSLDAANIHILIDLLKNIIIKDYIINLFTIHDCFATTPEYMKIVNEKVKTAFIKIYFDINYLEEMHDSFIKQIKSYHDIETEEIVEDGIHKSKQFIYIKNKKDKYEKYYIPDKPNFIKREDVKELFVNGITNSLYFIN